MSASASPPPDPTEDIRRRFAEITSGEELADLRRRGTESRWARFAFNPWTSAVVAVLFLVGCVFVSYALH